MTMFRTAKDDGVAMVTALLAIMILSMFSVLMLGLLLSQKLPTDFQRSSTQTIFAAEAGVNSVVGQIRSADAPPDSQGAVYGDNKQLPCSAAGPVDATGSTLKFSATISYFVTDPTDQSDAWRASHALGCTPGTGPSADPGFAVITSTGVGTPVAGMSATAGQRTVAVVYKFQVTNNNIPGGLIYSYDRAQTPDRYCLEAASTSAGAKIKYVPAIDCGSNLIHQLWIYDTDYRLKLASTTVPPATSAMCITGNPNGATPVPATLQVCPAPNDPARWNQLFSWEGGSHWRGQNDPVANGYSGAYLSSGQKGDPAGDYLYVWNQAASDNEWGSFHPDARVGAGAAGFNTHQIVNYLEFGRCMDVTHGDVNEPQMITYPCKQDPNPSQSQLNWNHKWYYDEPASSVGAAGPQQIYINNGTKYCLVSPGTESGWVTFTSGCSVSADNQKWTRYANTGAYSTSYTFVDAWGRCAAIGPSYKVGSNTEVWSTIITTTCNGSLGQKWNAPPNTVSASLNGYWELR